MDSRHHATTSALFASGPNTSTSSSRPATTASSSSSSLSTIQHQFASDQSEPFTSDLSRQQSQTMEAPLPSPSLAQPPSYFGVAQAHQHNHNTRASAQRQMYIDSLQRQATAQDSASPFLRDFSLVAEAAKRAQMAVLMRDLEACGFEEQRR